MTLNTRLFVGNLPDNINEHALREAFSSYGDITNFDLKTKSEVDSDNKKKFAFVTISASNFNVESCLKYFSNEDFNGNRLYVTKARESFLERLQRERDQSQRNEKRVAKDEDIHLPPKTRIVTEQHNTSKRKFSTENEQNENKHYKKNKIQVIHENAKQEKITGNFNYFNDVFHSKKNKKPKESSEANDNLFQSDKKKQDADKKRQESIKKKRQEYKEQKNIIKTGLISIDKQLNKKIIFTDAEDGNTLQESATLNGHTNMQTKTTLFDGEGSDDEINFEVKDQYEGKKGQKVLDLQSRYKSDKRFALDERFVGDSESEKEEESKDQEEVQLNVADEKLKQLNILQDVLGVTIKTKTADVTNNNKMKLGMLRFDPTQPEHAKYLVPVSNTRQPPKKSKKKKSAENKEEEKQKEIEPAVEKVEVSKEQFYKISDTLKETITQPTTFSLRSLFNKENEDMQDDVAEDANYIPVINKKSNKIKNPLDPGEKNPFVYDSSDSENEEVSNENEKISVPQTNEIKTVWRENLFFSITDQRLKDGLTFFTAPKENAGQKERRDLKSIMKKRIYNKERKNIMFQKKIGGRKKTMRKKFRKS